MGVVLLLALAAAAYHQAALTDVPRWGEEAARAWGDELETAMRGLARGVADHGGERLAAEAALPPAPEPRGLDWLILAPRAAPRAQGEIAYDSGCVRIDLTHRTADGRTVTDLAGASSGCLTLRATGPAGGGRAWRHEAGALLRTEGGATVLLHGPAFALTPGAAAADPYAVRLDLPLLNGTHDVIPLGAAGARVSLHPLVAAPDPEAPANADNVTLRIRSATPAAWRAWLADEMAASGAEAASWRVACDPVDCAGPGAALLWIDRPGAPRDDLRLSVGLGVLEARLG